MDNQFAFSKEEWDACVKVLMAAKDNPNEVPDVKLFKGLITKIHKKAKKGIKIQKKQEDLNHDSGLAQQTQIYKVHYPETPLMATDAVGNEYIRARKCYSCKNSFTDVHTFYHLLCPSCAELNYKKRFQTAALSGRTALITGGRIKIGYQTALRLLRDGAKVIITSRFPRDAAKRFHEERDFEVWKNRLHIIGLDLRILPEVESFIQYLNETEPHLDIIIHNAAQTIKRPAKFYEHLMELEKKEFSELPDSMQSVLSSKSQVKLWWSESKMLTTSNSEVNYFPKDTYDKDLQQVDLRPENSWLNTLENVSTVEMIEVQLVNSIAPFIFNSKLKGLLKKSPYERKFIVNVSAMEGQFNRENKTARHPHTNMAKAALNMMTRTSAQDYALDNIFMNSVDTGWITEENPFPIKKLKKEKGFAPPLDEVDGMARIYDPIATGINSEKQPVFGCFLKDYVPYPW